jgi:hypothetical protein
MSPIPLYLKTTPDMPRPTDPEFYWVTRDGAFLCRNHPFFTTDVPTRRPVKALAAHAAACEVRYPRVPVSTLEFVVGFFDRVYEEHRSESVVLLLWDLDRQRYRVWVPDQEATVWRSWSGARSPLDVSYTVPRALPERHLLVGDVHCHGNMPAYSSWTDRADERYRDGVHAIVGRIDDDPPEFHVELAVDGHRFELEPAQVFEGYRKRRRIVPRRWLDRVTVKIDGVRAYETRKGSDDWWNSRT